MIHLVLLIVPKKNRLFPQEMGGKALEQYVFSAASMIGSPIITNSSKVILLIVQFWPAAK